MKLALIRLRYSPSQQTMWDTKVNSILSAYVHVLPSLSHLHRPLHIGTHVLKDNYVAALGIDYDLKAPDFSYLAIAEIKEFYYNRHIILDNCKKIVAQMVPVIQAFNSDLIREIQTIHNAVHLLQNSIVDDQLTRMHAFASDLQTITSNATSDSTSVYELIELLSQTPHPPINLDAFRKIPALLEVTGS